MDNNYEHKEELKALLPEYLEILETEGKTEKRMRDFWDCPICGSGRGPNHSPAFHIFQDGTKFKCFSCENQGDIFDLVRYMEKMDDANYPKVYAKTEEIMKPYLEQQIRPKEIKMQEAEKQDYTKYLEKCYSQVALTDYFHARGLSDTTIDRFQLGFDPKRNSVIIPYSKYCKDRGYIQRVLWDSGIKYIKHGNELFNTMALFDTDSRYIFITEGQIDAMSFEEIGYHALGLGGVNETGRLCEVVKATDKCLILALDNDVSGQKATGKIIEALAEAGNTYKAITMNWIYGDYKDANEFLVRDREGFEKQIEKIVSVI